VPAVSSGIRGPVHVRLGTVIEAKGIPGAVPPNRIRYVLFERLGLDAVRDAALHLDRDRAMPVPVHPGPDPHRWVRGRPGVRQRPDRRAARPHRDDHHPGAHRVQGCIGAGHAGRAVDRHPPGLRHRRRGSPPSGRGREPDLTLARPHGATGRSALPIAGDDQTTKQTAAAFLDAIGYDACDAALSARAGASRSAPSPTPTALTAPSTTRNPPTPTGSPHSSHRPGASATCE